MTMPLMIRKCALALLILSALSLFGHSFAAPPSHAQNDDLDCAALLDRASDLLTQAQSALADNDIATARRLSEEATEIFKICADYSPDPYRVYFTSGDPDGSDREAIEQVWVGLIDGAESTIDLATFEMNNPAVTEALIRARERGVQVRLVVDNEYFAEATDPTDAIFALRDAGFALYCDSEQPSAYDIRCDDRSAFMLNNFMVIDGQAVLLGNIFPNANSMARDSASMIRFDSRDLAANFTTVFELYFVEGLFNQPGNPMLNLPNRLLNLRDSLSIESYFTPDEGSIIEARLIELIAGAERSINGMFFSFTVDSVGAAMLAQYADGLDLRLIFEGRAANFGQMPPLGCAGVPVRTDPFANSFLHEVIIIDGQTVLFGVSALSRASLSDNNEFWLLIQSEAIARTYLDFFERVWASSETPDSAALECS